MMNITNVNSGENGGLKRLLQHLVRIATWIGCGNQKVALVSNTSITSLNVSPILMQPCLHYGRKFFHYQPIALNFLENASESFGEPSFIPVCPSVSSWTAYDRGCRNIYSGYWQFLNALATCLNERKEPEPLGLFTELKDKSLLQPSLSFAMYSMKLSL